MTSSSWEVSLRSLTTGQLVSDPLQMRCCHELTRRRPDTQVSVDWEYQDALILGLCWSGWFHDGNGP